MDQSEPDCRAETYEAMDKTHLMSNNVNLFLNVRSFTA